jgi:hypothetical protein
MGDGTTSQPPSTTSSGTTVIIGGRRVYIPSGVIHVGGRTVRLRGPAEGSNASEVLWGYTYLMEDLAEREAARAQRLRQVANLRAQAAQLRSQAANPSLSQNQRDMLIAQAGFYEAQARSLIY